MIGTSLWLVSAKAHIAGWLRSEQLRIGSRAPFWGPTFLGFEVYSLDSYSFFMAQDGNLCFFWRIKANGLAFRQEWWKKLLQNYQEGFGQRVLLAMLGYQTVLSCSQWGDSTATQSKGQVKLATSSTGAAEAIPLEGTMCISARGLDFLQLVIDLDWYGAKSCRTCWNIHGMPKNEWCRITICCISQTIAWELPVLVVPFFSKMGALSAKHPL